ncbi:MAG: acyl-CoA synthetase [Dermatophilaceae bacterium]
MDDVGIGSWPVRRARITPDKVAIVDRGVSMTYAQLAASTNRLARGLVALGVRRGDRVAYLGYNSATFVETMFATAKAGAVFIPLNTRLVPPEWAYILADSGAAVLVWDEPFGQAVDEVLEGLAASPRPPRVPVPPPMPGLGDLVGGGRGPLAMPMPPGEPWTPAPHEGPPMPPGEPWAPAPQGPPLPPGPFPPGPPVPRLVAVGGTEGQHALDDVRAMGSDEPLDLQIGLEDLYMIQYTSGTTGHPKGVMMSHGNVSWNTTNSLVDVDLDGNEVSLIVAPMFHTAALNQQFMPTFIKGGTQYIEQGWDVEKAFDMIEEHGITFFWGPPTMYLNLMHSPRWESANLSSLRNFQCGGAPLPEAMLKAFADRGFGILQGYGLTEASPGTTMLRSRDSLTRIGSAGTSCFFTDVRVVGDDGQPVGQGETGEIQIQGFNVTKGYWGKPQATKDAILPGGWLRTGDLARVEEGGYLYIVDRLKDMIISGGENIYPAEIEAQIYTHPAVADCAVIGVADDRWGEVGRAVVVLRPGHTATEAEILEHLQGRLARYKIPKSVVLTDALPHNASGKLLKVHIRELHG